MRSGSRSNHLSTSRQSIVGKKKVGGKQAEQKRGANGIQKYPSSLQFYQIIFSWGVKQKQKESSQKLESASGT